jgi:hypothetical protein
VHEHVFTLAADGFLPLSAGKILADAGRADG